MTIEEYKESTLFVVSTVHGHKNEDDCFKPTWCKTIACDYLIDSFAKIQEVLVVFFAVRDGLVNRVKSLLGTRVWKLFSVVGKKSLRGITAGKSLNRN
jgi:hypothetical protein